MCPELLIWGRNTTEETHLSHPISTGSSSTGRDFQDSLRLSGHCSVLPYVWGQWAGSVHTQGSRWSSSSEDHREAMASVVTAKGQTLGGMILTLCKFSFSFSFVSFHVCLWIFACSSYHHSAVTCVMCADVEACWLQCHSWLWEHTDWDGRAGQGTPGSSWVWSLVLGYRHCNWLLLGARDMDSGPHGCAASHLPRPATTITWSRQSLLTHLMWDGTSFIWQLG